MKLKFYDMSKKQSVELPVTGKKTFTSKSGAVRYALTAKTAEGKEVFRFCGKADYDKASV